MDALPKPTRLAELASISVPYASQILGGSRSPSDAVAVRIFHAFGLKMGRLVKLTDDEIAVFAKMQGIEAQPNVHAVPDTPLTAPLSGGNGGEVADPLFAVDPAVVTGVAIERSSPPTDRLFSVDAASLIGDGEGRESRPVEGVNVADPHSPLRADLTPPHERRAGAATESRTGAATYFDDLSRVTAQ